MTRDKHLFQFSGAKISIAAASEAKYRRSRVEFWKAEQEIAIDKLKKCSVEVSEYPITGGVEARATINPELSRRASECASKIRDHQQAAERYEIEAVAYGTQGDRIYELQSDDVVYFRLGGGTRES